MRGRAAAGGDDALRDRHAVEVIGRGLDANEHDALAARGPCDGIVGVEHGAADRGARRGIQAFREPRCAAPRAGLEAIAQQLLDLRRLDARDGFFFRDQPFLDHVDGDLDGGRGGALRGARLQHVEAAALDRELEVLNVAIVLLELSPDALELRVDLRHLRLHLRDLRRRANARDDVLALRVGQVLTEQHVLAGVRVAREGDAGSGVSAHVAEYHRHDVDGRAEVVGDMVEPPIVAGALPEPAAEHGADREVELLLRLRRERDRLSFRE